MNKGVKRSNTGYKCLADISTIQGFELHPRMRAKTKTFKVNSNLTLTFPLDPQHINPMEEKQYFCLECLGYDFYMSSITLKDGFEAWLHMCSQCNIRMEYCGSP